MYAFLYYLFTISLVTSDNFLGCEMGLSMADEASLICYEVQPDNVAKQALQMQRVYQGFFVIKFFFGEEHHPYSVVLDDRLFPICVSIVRHILLW